MLHSHYGGKIEQFCKPHCMSQYTVLHYGVSGWTPHTQTGQLKWSAVIFLPFAASFCRWVDVIAAGNRAIWRRCCSVWVRSATSATCPACCIIASFILRWANMLTVTAQEPPHRRRAVSHMTLCFSANSRFPAVPNSEVIVRPNGCLWSLTCCFSVSSHSASPLLKDESRHSRRGLIGQWLCRSAQHVCRHGHDRLVHTHLVFPKTACRNSFLAFRNLCN